MESACIAVVGSLISEQFMITNKIPDLGESFAANSYSTALGGKGANAAMAAYRSCHNKPADEPTIQPALNASQDLDISVRMIGAVGDDDWGTQFTSKLGNTGIIVSGVKTVAGELTGTCFCIVEEDSRENRLLYHPGATYSLSSDDFRSVKSLGEGVLPDLVISQLEVRIEAVEQLIDMASEAGIDFLLNAAPASFLLHEKYKLLAHLIVNETEAAILSGRDIVEVNEDTWAEIAQEFLLAGTKNVVITLGARGAYYANGHASGHAQGFKVATKDPTGAG